MKWSICGDVAYYTLVVITLAFVVRFIIMELS